jgi:hypothetical protein
MDCRAHRVVVGIAINSKHKELKTEFLVITIHMSHYLRFESNLFF